MVIGIAVREATTKVTLDVVSRTEFLYGKMVKQLQPRDAQTVSVQSYHLFPVKD